MNKPPVKYNLDILQQVAERLESLGNGFCCNCFADVIDGPSAKYDAVTHQYIDREEYKKTPEWKLFRQLFNPKHKRGYVWWPSRRGRDKSHYSEKTARLIALHLTYLIAKDHNDQL